MIGIEEFIMTTTTILLVYGAAVALAALALYLFGSRRWYWHALSVIVALALGLAPAPPEAWRGQTYDVIIGFFFVLMLVWGMGGTLPITTHRTRHA
jgi:hypothetical protein